MRLMVWTRSFQSQWNAAAATLFSEPTSQYLSFAALSVIKPCEVVVSGKCFLLAHRFGQIARKEKANGEKAKAAVDLLRALSFTITGLFFACDLFNDGKRAFDVCQGWRMGKREGKELDRCEQLGCEVIRGPFIQVRCPGNQVCPDKGYAVLMS